MLMRMFRKLFGKRTKVCPFTKEKENETNDFKLEEFAQENKDQEHLQAEMKTLKTLEDGHEVLLSMHMIFKKHAECSENLLREMEKLTDSIKKTQFTPVPGLFSPSSCSFSSVGIRLPPIKELQYSSVGSSLHAVESSQCSSKLAWGANESISNNTEETFLTGNEMNETELQTVNEIFTGQETKTSQNEPHLEMEFHAKMDKWSMYEKEERLKLKLEMAEATLRRQKETKDLKLKINFLEKEAKHEKQEMKKKLKDLEKEIKKEKAMLHLKLKELKKKLKMEKTEMCDEEKMEQHRQDDDEKVDDVQYKNI